MDYKKSILLKNLSKNKIVKLIAYINPSLRKFIFILIDLLIIPFVLWFGFWVKHEDPYSEEFLSSLWIIKTSLSISIPLYLLTGQYKSLTRYVGSKSLYFLISRNALLVLLIIVFGKVFNLTLPSGGNLIIFWLLISLVSGGIRFLLRDLLLYFSDFNKKRKNSVVIYGAGSSGAQLEANLRLSSNYFVKFFVDDDKSLWGRSLNDIPIKKLDFLKKNNENIDQILIAIPSLKKKRL